jgi:hypothetical protein
LVLTREKKERLTAEKGGRQVFLTVLAGEGGEMLETGGIYPHQIN